MPTIIYNPPIKCKYCGGKGWIVVVKELNPEKVISAVSEPKIRDCGFCKDGWVEKETYFDSDKREVA